MNVWIAIQGAVSDGEVSWELAGVFSSIEAAQAACVEVGDGIAGPFELDAVLPRETVYVPTAYWPDFEWLEPVAVGSAL